MFSSELEEFEVVQDIQHILIGPAVPRVNDKVEVVNRSIRGICVKLANSNSIW